MERLDGKMKTMEGDLKSAKDDLAAEAAGTDTKKYAQNSHVSALLTY